MSNHRVIDRVLTARSSDGSDAQRLNLSTAVDRPLLCLVLVPLCLVAFGLEFLLFGVATLVLRP